VVAFAVLLVVLISQVLILLFGFGVTCAARRRPLTTNAIIGAVVLVGFGAIWCGGEIAPAGLRAGLSLLVAGLTLVFVGVPTWGLVPAARAANRPAGLIGWARLLATYLAACWIFTIFLGLPVAIFVQLATAPPGSLR
jgi:hypothetical protein